MWLLGCEAAITAPSAANCPAALLIRRPPISWALDVAASRFVEVRTTGRYQATCGRPNCSEMRLRRSRATSTMLAKASRISPTWTSSDVVRSANQPQAFCMFNLQRRESWQQLRVLPGVRGSASSREGSAMTCERMRRLPPRQQVSGWPRAALRPRTGRWRRPE